MRIAQTAGKLNHCYNIEYENKHIPSYLLLCCVYKTVKCKGEAEHLYVDPLRACPACAAVRTGCKPMCCDYDS